MSTPTDERRSRPVDGCSTPVVELARAVAATAEAGVPDVDEALRADLAALLPLRARVEALVAERLAAFDRRGLCRDHGLNTATSWVTSRCNISGGEAAGLLATGRRMTRFPAMAGQLSAGEVSPRHVRILERAVAGLPERLTQPAVEFLTPLAAEHDPVSFGVISHQLRETLTPELTDQETADLLDSQWLDVSPFDGGLRVDGMLRGLNAEAFHAAIRRFSAPKPNDDRTAKARRADAAGELARVATEAPIRGLPPVQVTVICDVGTLERAARAASEPGSAQGAVTGTPRSKRDLTIGAHGEHTRAPLDWRALIGAVTTGETRRLVLGPDSEVLDLGRAHRCFTRTQRIAIRRGDHRCRVRGCHSPYVEYDHKTGWAQGGSTDVANGRPFCGFHNRLRTHGWTTIDLPNNQVRLIQPPNWHLRRHRQRRPRIE